MIALLALLLQTQDPLDRLVAEMKGPSKERRAVAQAVIRAYGEVAAERLAKEGLDPSLARGAPPPDPSDPGIRRSLKSKRVTLDQQNVSLSAILKHLEVVCGVRIEIDRASIPHPEGEQVSFKVSDIVADGVLRLMLGPRQHRYFVQGGRVIVAGIEARDEDVRVSGPGRAPVRIAGDPSAAPPLVAALAAEGVAERERAEDALRALQFAAAGALWEALEAKDAEVQGRAAGLLRRLYTPRLTPSIPPLEAKLQAARIRGEGALEEIRIHVEKISLETGVPLLFDLRRSDPSIKVDPVTWECSAWDALSHLLTPQKLKIAFLDGAGIITSESAPIGRTRWEGPVWLPFDEAKAVERHLAELASPEADRQRRGAEALVRMGWPALEPLLQAARVLEPAVAGRCRDAAARIDAWLVDGLSGPDLQDLTGPQRRILEATHSAHFVSTAWSDVLAAIVKAASGRLVVRARLDRDVSQTVKDAKVGPILKALTRPYGLDYYLDGDTVVVDTAANVRAAVAK